MNITFLHSQLRSEEKLLLQEMREQNVDITKLDVRKYNFNINQDEDMETDLVFERALSLTHGINAIRYFETNDYHCINNSEVLDICGNKIRTSLNLKKYGVHQPNVSFAQSNNQSLEIIDNIGYPVVLKPIVGSWGRLLSKINDKESAETILEHKERMGYMHSTHYIQEFINKPGRDIRSFVVGDECIAAIYRNSQHWITNTSRGGNASNCPLSDEIVESSLQAARAITDNRMNAILAVDLFEGDEILVNEVNATMEFRNSIQTTGVDIPGKIVEFLRREIS